MKLKNNPYVGKLIVFEGTDGAGKTTMIALTEKLLLEHNGEDSVLTVKQPTDLSRKTKLFQKMMYCENHEDIDYRAVQLLTMSDRVQHGHEIIAPALENGKTVICDRYVFTSLANMLARGYTHEKWFFQAAKNLLRPDAAFLAYVSPQLAIKRIKSRPSECDRHLDENLLVKVAAQFRSIAARERFTVLDTSRSPETAFEAVKNTLRAKGILQ